MVLKKHLESHLCHEGTVKKPPPNDRPLFVGGFPIQFCVRNVNTEEAINDGRTLFPQRCPELADACKNYYQMSQKHAHQKSLIVDRCSTHSETIKAVVNL
jgi:hypothetical protein